MKCRYCGSNLGLEDAVCPYCGKVNKKAAKYLAEKNKYLNEFEKTKTDVKEKSKTAGRIGRLAVIGVMLILILVMKFSVSRYSDVEYRINKREDIIASEVNKNRDSIAETVKEMEKNREYVALSCYILNYRLRSNEQYDDYFRVFTAAISYRTIYEDIISIVTGFEGYDNKTTKDWCYDAAIYISDWNSYVAGGFWNDSPDSPMHAGEHGAFLADAKKDAQDMVQVYFNLTDEQAESMWTMDKEALGELLYESCKELYPKEAAVE